ncbi:AfsR/SARP family transcriptional regulator [Streptomyces asiaticus]|uniref:AfsR/SARP family transcriptional regulator n=1 Tax=Streptomyces asiaticus TaxID=114695 RepID=UPI003820CE63
MDFHLLGPLEVLDDGVPVPLGGVIKRGALAHLLIHANSVVATSRLLAALWPGDTPLTARKMLQNAVRDLRRTLSCEPGSEGRATLVTDAPGYRLRVDPDTVDLLRFRRAVERGQAEVAAGSYESAARVLREALGLWRGPALADLVEDGLVWPELTAWENSRLNAQEDLFEAELACGRHHAVLGELQAVAAAEPTRERLSCQLMLALYRCGRQTEALAAYRHRRLELVERYGLEPTREMQKLERAILAHDPELDPPSPPALVDGPGLADLTPLPRPDAAREAPATPAQGRAGLAAVGGRATRPRRLSEFTVEHKRISLVWVRHALEGQGHDPSSVQDALREAERVVREEVARFGGTMGHATGPVFSALFGHPETSEDDAARAVRAAFAMRDRFAGRGMGSAGPALRGPGPACLHVAVVTGDAYLLFRPGETDTAPRVMGEAADRCFRLLALAPRGQVRVCEVTRRASEPVIAYRVGPEPPDGWEAVRVRRQGHGTEVRHGHGTEVRQGHGAEVRRTAGPRDWAALPAPEPEEVPAHAAL